MAHPSASLLEDATANQQQRLLGAMKLNRPLYSQGQV